MAKSTRPYVVRSGEYITAIAHANGLDPITLWEHADNADLRKTRSHPEMLAPGDILYLPKPKAVKAPLTVGGDNAFVSNPPSVSVAITLNGSDGKPLAGKAVRVEEACGKKDYTTGGDGSLQFNVPCTTRVAVVRVVGTRTSFKVKVGNLDPHDSDAGALSRLRQLGFSGDEAAVSANGHPALQQTGDTTNDADAAQARLSQAVTAFQTAMGLPVTGQLDDATRSKLAEKYGS